MDNSFLSSLSHTLSETLRYEQDDWKQKEYTQDSEGIGNTQKKDRRDSRRHHRALIDLLGSQMVDGLEKKTISQCSALDDTCLIARKYTYLVDVVIVLLKRIKRRTTRVAHSR